MRNKPKTFEISGVSAVLTLADLQSSTCRFDAVLLALFQEKEESALIQPDLVIHGGIQNGFIQSRAVMADPEPGTGSFIPITKASPYGFEPIVSTFPPRLI